jgi:hypothetical protein
MAKIKNQSIGDMEKDWQTESDIRTLLEAKKIKNDPKRMQCVREMAKSKLEGMASLVADQDNA